MIKNRRKPKILGIISALFLVLILSLVGCEKGTLGLKGGSISGNILDSRTLTGVSGVSVKAVAGDAESKVTKYTTSDSNGNYYLSDIRADEWTLTFDKTGYQPVDAGASSTFDVVTENSKNVVVPEVRMVSNYENQYVTISGTLKDAITGAQITYGNAQFIFGQTSFSNRMPTEFQTGFRIPASQNEINLTISVAGYKSYSVSEAVTTDQNLGVVLLQPETYSVIGRWKDIPGWVFQDNPRADVFAYAGSKLIATTSANLNTQQFEITGIPKGTSVSISVELKGYRMNGPIVVHPTGDFQGSIYQTFSLKNNFSQIMRNVKIIVSGTGISTNDQVGAFCNETGTQWGPTLVSNPAGITIGTPRVIDLGAIQVPTGYTLHFSGYVVGAGTVTTTSGIYVNDDGSDPQIVPIQVN